jgi:phage shock protein PspC (stress-responsive transcriptional regulator)
MNKKFTKLTDNKFIGGVCGGIGAYIGIDATFVRVIFGILFLGLMPATFFIGTTFMFILYCLLWVVLPKSSSVSKNSAITINCKNANKTLCQFTASQGNEYCKGCGAKMNDIIQY